MKAVTKFSHPSHAYQGKFSLSSDLNRPELKVDAEIKRLQADYDSKQYQRDRAVAYPSIQDQLDMQYHDAVDGTTTWKDAIAKVKSDNPKPS